MIRRLLLLLCLMLTAGSVAQAEIASGKWNNGHWSISDEGELYVNCNSVSSDFSMPDYGEGKAPWYKYREEIKAIRIGSTLRNVGRNAFYDLKYVEKVTGGENVESIAKFAFQYCGGGTKDNPIDWIPSITFPKCSYVGEQAFAFTRVTSISLPLVETYKADAIIGGKMVDLGSKVKMLRPGSVNGPEYVFIQNPTPPEWERLYSTDEEHYYDHDVWARVYCYPFGGSNKYSDHDVFVIVPKEYLQTYIDYYPRKHPEVGFGYMCACYLYQITKNKNEETYNRGKLTAGAPIYEDGQLIGGWYVEKDTLKVFFEGKSMPSYESGNAPWNSVLGTVTKMSITSLGTNSFLIPDNCFRNGRAISGISELYIEATHVYIGNNAFENCTDLTNLQFFYLNSGIKKASIVDSGNGAFAGCTKLENIYAHFWSFAPRTFYNCKSLSTIDSGPDTKYIHVLRTIPEECFYGCEAFDSYDFSIIDEIEKRAFANSGLREAYLGESCKKIGEQAFANCTKLGTLTMPTYVFWFCKWESKAFMGCTGLKDVFVSNETVPEVTPSDFFEGVDLQTVTLHADPSIYNSDYENHPVWGKMTLDKEFILPVNGGNDDYRWELSEAGTLTISGSVLPSKWEASHRQPWHIYREFVKSIIIDNGIEYIGNYFFADLENLENVSMPRTVKAFYDYVFKGCSSLKNIYISSVEELGNNVFEGCSALEYIDLGMGLKKAGDYIFKNCISLKLIGNKDAIPAETTELTFAEIGSEAYHLRGGRRKAANGQAAVTLNVPDEFVTNYIIDPNWGKFHIKFADGRGTWEHAGRFGDGTWILYDDSTMVVAAEKATGVDYVNFPTEIYKMTKRIEISGSITSLGDCFKYFENLESVSLCPSIKELNGTFYYCSKLTYINLDNVETIGDDTFINCGMTTIDLSNVKNVGKDAFESCQELVAAKLGSSCVVDKRVFSNCSALSLVDLGNANLDNAVGCFNACDNLKKIAYNGQNLPKGIFSGCTALEEVKLGSRVRSIQWSAFEGCTALKTIYCDSPMPPSLPVEKTQDIIGYEGTGDVQTPILGPEYDVWAFHDLDRPSIKLYVHPDCVPVYGRFDVWKEMDIQGNAEDVEPLLPTGGSLRGSGKDEEGNPVMSGSTWYLDEEGKLTLDALGNIAARTSDMNYWWSVFDSYLPFIATVEVTDDVTGVPNNMFGWMDSDRLTRGVTTVILGEGLKKAGYDTFHFSGIKDVYLYTENLVDFHGATFNRDAAVTNNATLHVLKDPEDKYLNYYKALPATKYFPNIVADLDPRHPKVQAVNFDFSEITLRPGEELQLDPHFTPADVEDKTLRYVDASNGHHVYIDSDNGIIFAQSEGVAYIEAFSSYTVSGEEVMALWGPTQEIYLKITISAPEPGQEIFFDYREGEGTDAPTITCHVLRDEQLDVDTWVKTCEIAGQYNEDDILTQAIPEWRTGTVNIPEEAMGYEVVRLGAYSFYERQISALYIPWTVTQIGYNACARCDYLTDVYIPSFKPLRLTDAYGEEDENLWNNDAFYRIGEGDDGEGYATLHVPEGSKTAWDIYPWNEWFRYIVEDAPIPDAIKSLTPALSEGEGVWYDLSGRKLGDKPAKPGLYIQNGRKVVIK